jgi:hypothetical protein
MKKIILIFFVACLGINSYSQIYMTKNGFIGFYSQTAFEDIKAENNQVYAVIDIAKKNIAFTLLIKGFLFPKELMQEHFNENYIESNKYPKASFVGNFTGDADLNKPGIYTISVKGRLSLHNVSQIVETTGTLEIKDGKVTGQSQFKIKPENFNIQIPAAVRDKIAKEILVIVKAECTSK